MRNSRRAGTTPPPNKHIHYNKYLQKKQISATDIANCSVDIHNQNALTVHYHDIDKLGQFAASQTIDLSQPAKYQKLCSKGSKASQGIFFASGFEEFRDKTARTDQVIYICGGFADAVAVAKTKPAAIVLAVIGEGTIEKMQLRIIKKYPLSRVIGVYDADGAGHKAHEENKYQSVVTSGVIGCKDASDIYLKDADKLVNLLDQVPPATDQYIELLINQRKNGKLTPKFFIVMLSVYKHRKELHTGIIRAWFLFFLSSVQVGLLVKEKIKIFQEMVGRFANVNINTNELEKLHNSSKSINARKAQVRELTQLSGVRTLTIPHRTSEEIERLKNLALSTFSPDDISNYIISAQSGLYSEDLARIGTNIADIVNHDLICLDWALGLGKTEHAINPIIKHVSAQNKQIVIIVNSQSLADSVAEKFKFDSYKPMKSGKYKRKSNAFVTCTPSLKNPIVQAAISECDLIIIDECVSVLNQLTSDLGVTGEDKEQTKQDHYFYFKSILDKKLLLADANLNQYAFNEYLRLSGKTNAEALLIKKPLYEIKKSVNIVCRNLHADASETAKLKSRFLVKIYQTILKHNDLECGKTNTPVMVCCEGKETATKVASVFQSYNENLKILLITSDNNADTEVKRFFNNPNQESSKYHAIIHTTALQAGVSITAPVTAVFALYQNNKILPEDLVQMLGRARKANQVYIYCTDRRRAYNSISAKKQIETVKGAIKKTTTSPEFLAFQINQVHQQDTIKASAMDVLHELLEQNGYSVQIARSLLNDDEYIDLGISKITEAISKAYARETVRATRVDNKQYNQYQEQPTTATIFIRLKHLLERITYTDANKELNIEEIEILIKNLRALPKQIKNRTALDYKLFLASSSNNSGEDNEIRPVSEAPEVQINQADFIDHMQKKRVEFFNKFASIYDYKQPLTQERAAEFFKVLSCEKTRILAVALGVHPATQLEKKEFEFIKNSPHSLANYKNTLSNIFGCKFERTADNTGNFYKIEAKSQSLYSKITANRLRLGRGQKQRLGEEFRNIQHLTDWSDTNPKNKNYFRCSVGLNPIQEVNKIKMISNETIKQAFINANKCIDKAAAVFNGLNKWSKCSGYSYKIDNCLNVEFREEQAANDRRKAIINNDTFTVPAGLAIAKCNSGEAAKQLQKLLKIKIKPNLLQKLDNALYYAFSVPKTKKLKASIKPLDNVVIFTSGNTIRQGVIKVKSSTSITNALSQKFCKLPNCILDDLLDTRIIRIENPNKPTTRRISPDEVIRSNKFIEFFADHQIDIAATLAGYWEYGKEIKGSKCKVLDQILEK